MNNSTLITQSECALQNAKVLVVDDNYASLETLSEILRTQGFSVYVAEDGDSAFSVINETLPDLILLDIMMPGMDGFEICTLLKNQERTKEIPIIFISALHETFDKLKAFTCGAVDYLIRPLQLEEVLARVTTHVRLYLLQKQLKIQNQQLQTEVEERRKAEKALEENHRSMSTLLSNLPGMAYRSTGRLPCSISFVSQGCYALTGYQPEEFIQNPKLFSTLVHQQDCQIFEKSIDEAIKNRELFVLHYRLYTAEGEEKWVWEQGQGIFDESGQLEAVEGLIIDITPRKQAEKALENSEKRFRNLVEKTPVGLCIINEEGYFEFINDAYADMLHYKPAELINQHFTKMLFEDQKAFFLDQHKKFFEENRQEMTGEWTIKNKYDEKVTILAKAAMLVGADNRLKKVSFIIDITNRKQMEEALRLSEEKFREFFENQPEYCYILGEKGQILDVNTAALQALGYKKQELIGQNGEVVYPDKFKPSFQHWLSRCWTSQTPLKNLETQIVTCHQQCRPVLLSLTVIKDYFGNFLYAIMVQRDIHELKLAEQAQHKIEKLLRAVIDNFPNGLVSIYDDNYRFLLCGGKVLEKMGFNGDQMIDKTIFELYPPEVTEFVLPYYQQAFNGQLAEFELLYDQTCYEIVAAPLRDEKQIIYAILVIAIDITTRKQAEILLKERLEFIEFVNRISFEFINTYAQAIEPLINKALAFVTQFVAVERGYIFLLSQDQKELELVSEWSQPQVLPYRNILQSIQVDKLPQLITQLRKGFPVKLQMSQLDAQTDQEMLQEIFHLLHIQSAIYLPLMVDQQLIGVIGFDTVKETIVWSDEIVNTFNIIGQIILTALQRKKSEKVLRETNALLDATQRLAKVGGWEINLETGALAWTTEMYFISETDENFKPSLEDNLKFYHPHHRHIVHTAVLQAIENGKPYDLELKYITAKGRELWVRTIGNPIFKDGKVVKLSGTFQDITERKQAEINLVESEGRYRSLFDNIADMVFVADLEGHFLDVNHAAYHRLGYSYTELLALSAPHLGFAMQPNQDTVLQSFVAGLNQRQTVFEMEYPTKDNHKIPVEVSARLIRYQGKTAILGVARDITERKQSEAELKVAKEIAEKARQQAETANQAKSTFLANMSHELRTPLNGILGYAQILNRDKMLSDKQRTGIRVIQRSGEHLLTLINDILDLSKIEEGRLEILPHELVLSAFLKDIVDLFQFRAQEKGIEFNYIQIPPHHALEENDKQGFPAIIYADEKRLRQILINLISNAVKFTEKGSVTLRLIYQNDRMRIEIEDTGCGISAHQQEEIFLPFRQARSGLQHTEGTGLGLAITKKLVELMDGQLNVQSLLGVGSLFWLDFPVQVVQRAQKSSGKSSTILPTLEGYKTKQNKVFKVLIADEKWENRLTLANSLFEIGFEILEVDNGKKLLEEVKTHRPEIIIIDIKMPDIDGLTCIMHMRDNMNLKESLIIATSASASSYEQEASLSAGCNTFLTKPLETDKVLKLIEKHWQLEWIYKAAHTDASLQTMVIPKTEEIEALYKLAKSGNVKLIIRESEALLQANSEYQAFVNEILKLTKGFRIIKLKAFLKQYLSE